jgi:hypothetical protein
MPQSAFRAAAYCVIFEGGGTPMPLITSKPVQLPEELGMYVDALRKQYSTIAEVWLLDPQTKAGEAPRKRWELLMFADAEVLDALRSDPTWYRDHVRLRIVVDGESFETPFGEPRSGRLSEMKWRLEDLQKASYVDTAPDTERAAQESQRSALRVR